MKSLFIALLPLCVAFSPKHKVSKLSCLKLNSLSEKNDLSNPTENKFDIASILLTSTALNFLLPAQEALAKGGEYGLLEGRIGSMMHPLTMLALFGTSVYSGYLGLQWRNLREIGEKLKQLNSDIPKLSSGMSASFPLSGTISKLRSEITSLNAETDASQISKLNKDISTLSSQLDLDITYTELSNTRKELVAANLRDKHYATGSVLLGVGVGVALLGAMNTYLRAGKLFPGPHLYAGAGIVGLWAAAAALVPAMQKGNDAARLGHISLNSLNVALFAWQVYTGFDIMTKVWEKTSWP